MMSNYKRISAGNKVINYSNKIAGRKKLKKSNKRQQTRDRRSSVRDGVIVSLSFQSNRRNGSDRRALQTVL